MPSHRNPYVRDESECSCIYTFASPLSSRQLTSFDPAISSSYPTNPKNRIPAGSTSIQVDDEFDESQLRLVKRDLAILENDVNEGEEHSPREPQMTLDGEEICCYECGGPIQTSNTLERKGHPNTASVRGGSSSGSGSGIGESSSSKPGRHLPEWYFAEALQHVMQKDESRHARNLQIRNNYLVRQVQKYKEKCKSAEEAMESCGEVLRESREEVRELRDSNEELRAQRDHLSVKLAERKRAEVKGERREEEAEGSKSKGEGKGQNIAVPNNEEREDALGATLFYFYPATSTIVLPGLPARILRFPRGTDLPGIHDYVDHQFKIKNERGEAAKIVRKIMNANTKLGIELPSNLREQAVIIRVPEGYEDLGVLKRVKIAAWTTVEGEDGYTEIVPRKYEEKMPFRPRPTREAPEPQAKEKIGRTIPVHSPNLASFLAPDTSLNPSAATSPSDSICSCTLCASEREPCDLVQSFVKPQVSVRGGADNEDYGDYDDYFDNDEYYDDGYDDDGYGYGYDGYYDSDDSDEEITHEDEAQDPWDDGW